MLNIRYVLRAKQRSCRTVYTYFQCTICVFLRNRTGALSGDTVLHRARAIYTNLNSFIDVRKLMQTPRDRVTLPTENLGAASPGGAVFLSTRAF